MLIKCLLSNDRFTWYAPSLFELQPLHFFFFGTKPRPWAEKARSPNQWTSGISLQHLHFCLHLLDLLWPAPFPITLPLPCLPSLSAVGGKRLLTHLVPSHPQQELNVIN